MKPLKILFGLSTNVSLEAPMGSEIAASSMAHALSKRGHYIQAQNLLWAGFEPRAFDLVHLWNASGNKGPYALAGLLAKKERRPLFATPIFWPLGKGELKAIYLSSHSKKNVKSYRKLREFIDRALAEALTQADHLCPNSRIEGEKVSQLLANHGLPCPPQTIIPNVFNEDLFKDKKYYEWKKRPNWIVCAARIEPAKNTLNLIRAFKLLKQEVKDARLYLLGEIAPGYPPMDELACPGLELVGPQPQKVVIELLLQSRVHALLGLHETPGLASLEAAAAGCSIVVSNPEYGSMRDYFSSYAIETDPFSPKKISQALALALEENHSELRDLVWEKFRAERVAKDLEALYSEVIDDGCE
ncbi:MAG: glycosyltransferase family 4 protein [Candidatus Methanosuratincola petrocarbonis]